jgi:hypothetical protein
MHPNEDFLPFEALELNAITEKLVHRKAGKGWARERAEAAEREYRRFLFLAKIHPEVPLAPTVDVDEFWHYHILDTKKYGTDCERLFGYFLHHFPYAGMRGEQDELALQRIGERTRAMYAATFSDKVDACPGAGTEPARTAFSAAVRLSKAYGAPSSGPAQGATRFDADTAFCYTPDEKAAAKTAFCYTPDAKAVAETAFCYTPDAGAVAETAFCYTPVKATSAKTAFCYTPDAKSAAGTAFCYTPDAKTAAETAFCYTPDARRPLEERAGFYVERPPLPST